MLFRTVGNICAGVALLLYAVPLPLLLTGDHYTHDGSQGEAWALIFLLLPLWFCLTLALCASNAQGGLDWIPIGKGSRYGLAMVTCLAMAVASGLSGLLRKETADQIPWAVRPLVPWAIWIVPLVVLLFCLFTLNPDLSAGVPRWVLRAPLGAVGGLSLLVGFGLLTQAFISSQEQQAARVDAAISADTARTQQQMEEVKALDAAKQLSQALGYTNRYNDPKLRELALEKIRAVPDLEQQLAEGLRSPWCEPVLIFLDAADPPDNRPLAAPALEAFSILTGRVRDDMKDAGGQVYPDSFEFDARLMLSVAYKFRGLGVDYVPAVRAYRAALDLPRDPQVKFRCASELDEWLAREAKRSH